MRRPGRREPRRSHRPSGPGCADVRPCVSRWQGGQHRTSAWWTWCHWRGGVGGPVPSSNGVTPNPAPLPHLYTSSTRSTSRSARRRRAADPHPAARPIRAGRPWGSAAVDPASAGGLVHNGLRDPRGRTTRGEFGRRGARGRVRRRAGRTADSSVDAGHQVTGGRPRPLDADLAILGAGIRPLRARGVRASTALDGDLPCGSGCASTAPRPLLFTAVAHARFDAAARANLARERAGLEP
jgi:hypothetical protein